MSVGTQIKSLFHNSQFNRSTHEKLIKQMRQEYDTLPLEQFFREYIRCLIVIFKIGEKHASVDLSLDFASKFSVSIYYGCDSTEVSSFHGKEDEMPTFLKKLFDWLFATHYAKDQSIRFRVCQFINKLLHNLGDEASLDDDLCDKISSNMLERLQDKVPAVRVQAVMALQRLQDPTSPDCPIIKAYLFHLSADPSTIVRRSVLTIIGRTNVTLPHILERTRDVKDTVRRHAYLVLSKLNIRSLTIRQRERLLHEGLKDRSEHVSNFVSEVLLQAWLRNMKGNYMDLLHALDVENSTETSILALKMLFKHRPLTEILESIESQQTDKLIPLDKLTPENVLFWRCVAQHLHAEGEEMADNLEKIIPNLTPFCQYIRSYYLEEKPKSNSTSWHEIQRQFVVLQLLEVTKVFDLADEMGRSTLKKLIYDMLTCTHVKEGLVPILVELLVEVEPNVNSRLQFLAEIVSEVHEPMTQVSVEMSAEEVRKKQVMQAKIRVQLNEIREEQETAIVEQDFLRAHTLVEKMKELEEEFRKLATETPVTYKEVRTECNDRATLSKCLSIIYEMMQSPTVTKLTPHLRSLMENFVLQYIEDCDTYVRSLALRATGVFCLLDQDLAKQYMLMLFFQLANNETDEVCLMALKVIFDIFHLYGLQPFQMEDDFAEEKEPDRTGKKKLFDAAGLEENDDDNIDSSQCGTMNGNSNNFISILTSLLDSTSADMRTVAAEGLCRLLLAHRIKSPNLVSRLFIMWYNPVTEGDVYLRQMLAAFFTTFASHSSWGQETLEQAFLPTLRTLFDAPLTSPLVEVDQDSVVRLLLSLTRPGMNTKSAQCNVHNNLAIALCNEVLVDPDSYNSQVLLRALTQLDLIKDDAVILQNIKTLTQAVIEAVKDKTYLRHIKKFEQMLIGTERTMTSNGTGTNLEVTSATSENSNGRLTLNKAQSSPVNIEVDSDGSDDTLDPSTPHPVTKRIIPETPENSDSPLSVSSVDTCSSFITQLDGKTGLRTPMPIRSSSTRRSDRLAKKKSQE